MADTYEKDLAQKSSLTTSDFIRVVGSDNVSYKQSISDVMDVMGVDGLMMPSNIIPSGSTVETYANGLSRGFHLACNNSSSTATAQGAPFTCPCTYYITVYTVNEHIQIICQPWNPNVANSKTLAVKTKYGGTWSGWTIMPTRAEVDALNSNSLTNYTQDGSYTTSKVVNIPATPKMLLVYAYGGSGDNAVFFVNSFSSSNVEPRILMIGSGFTHSYDNSTRKLTIVRNNGNTFSISTFNA